jgi:hypothetical protein
LECFVENYWPGNGNGGEADLSGTLLTITLWQLRSKSRFLFGFEKIGSSKNKSKDKMRGFFAALRMTSTNGDGCKRKECSGKWEGQRQRRCG